MTDILLATRSRLPSPPSYSRKAILSPPGSPRPTTSASRILYALSITVFFFIGGIAIAHRAARARHAAR